LVPDQFWTWFWFQKSRPVPGLVFINQDHLFCPAKLSNHPTLV
jgi:hypothetical protein